eukprot:m.140517 g.140517  ORF g.140517 m.140517 type:complete len:598 (+) comp17087_c0_seq2:273-2066(+)
MSAASAGAGVMPYSQITALYFTMLANAVTLTMPFPFLPFMVRDFGFDKPEQVGYYAGLLASSLFLGRSLCAYAWGAQADIIGRKPVLLLSLMGINVFTLMFGFSKSFGMALFARSLTGLVNGTPQTSKIVVSEICNKHTAPRAMALVATSAGVGMIVGPAIGGLLCEPADRYAWLDITLFREFPYLLPCLCSCAISTFSTILVQTTLVETLGKSDKDKDVGSSGLRGDATRRRLALLQANDTDTDSTAQRGQHWVLPNDGRGADKGSAAGPTHQEQLGGNKPVECGGSQQPATAVTAILKRFPVFRVLSVYALLGLSGIGLNELFPVWTSSPHEVGGLEWDATRIGWSLTTSGLILIFGQTYIYGAIQRRFGTLGTFRMCTLAAAVSGAVLPFASDAAFVFGWGQAEVPGPVMLRHGLGASNATVTRHHALYSQHSHRPHHPRHPHLEQQQMATTGLAVTVVVTAANTMVRVMFNCCFVSTFLFVNNCVKKTERGRIQGLAMAFTAIMRAVGPSLGGAIYSWSIAHPRPLPLDHHLAFLVLSAVVVGVYRVARKLDSSLNNPLEEQGDVDVAVQRESTHDRLGALPTAMPGIRGKQA